MGKNKKLIMRIFGAYTSVRYTARVQLIIVDTYLY